MNALKFPLLYHSFKIKFGFLQQYAIPFEIGKYDFVIRNFFHHHKAAVCKLFNSFIFFFFHPPISLITVFPAEYPKRRKIPFFIPHTNAQLINFFIHSFLNVSLNSQFTAFQDFFLASRCSVFRIFHITSSLFDSFTRRCILT